MRHQVLDQIAQERVIEAGAAPAACVGLAFHFRDAHPEQGEERGGWRVYTGAAGNLPGMDPETRAVPCTPEAVFDLASVSKPFLAVLCARLIARGQLSWQTALGQLLPAVQGTPMQNVSIDALLSHRAGLVAHIRVSAPLEAGRAFCRADALRRVATSVRPECLNNAGQPQPPLYSDLGYLLVSAALERITGEAVDHLLAREVCIPLGLAIGSARQWMTQLASSTPGLAPVAGFKERVAPTERVAWRGSKLRGVVHDDNSWALAGHGAAGHAGLFSSVEPLLRFGAKMADAVAGRDASFLSPADALRLVTSRPGGTLACGFDGKATGASSAGPSAGPRTFGHLGFTGTSLWCDPEMGAVTVILSNRVNPSRTNQRLRHVRPIVHEALFQLGRNPSALDGSSAAPA